MAKLINSSWARATNIYYFLAAFCISGLHYITHSAIAKLDAFAAGELTCPAVNSSFGSATTNGAPNASYIDMFNANTLSHGIMGTHMYRNDNGTYVAMQPIDCGYNISTLRASVGAANNTDTWVVCVNALGFACQNGNGIGNQGLFHNCSRYRDRKSVV